MVDNDWLGDDGVIVSECDWLIEETRAWGQLVSWCNGGGVTLDSLGRGRILDVVDVRTQDAIGMRMRDWCIYYKCPQKTQLLNVISLEYSQSRLDSIVKAPTVVCASLLVHVMG